MNQRDVAPPDGWKWSRVESIAAEGKRSIAIGPFGSSLRSEMYVQEGFPVIRGQDIKDGRYVSLEDPVFVPEGIARSLSGAIVEKGDLVFPHRGAIGAVGLVEDRSCLLSSSMMKLTCDPATAHPEFVLYYFRGPGREELLNRASTVGTPGIGQPLRSLKSVPILVPSLVEQRAIAAVLSALDDKVAANRKLVSIAEELAMSLFVEALNRSSVERSLVEVAQLITRGVAPKYTEDESELIVLNQKCVRDNRVNLAPARKTLRSKARESKLLRTNDVLVNSTGQGTLGRVARWCLPVEATVDSHVSIVRFDEAEVDPVCAGFAVLQAQQAIESMGEGSTGQTELSREQLGRLRLRFILPDSEMGLRDRLESLVGLSVHHLNECDTLAATRDALLPRLMSGELRVRDAERQVEAVL